MISINGSAAKARHLCIKKEIMKIKTNELIAEMLLLTERSSAIARRLQTLPPEKLNHKPNATSWSALECIEHLNLYGDYYLPEIQRQILASSAPASPVFHAGVIGNYFAKLMKAENGKVGKKMKSPKDKDPKGSRLTTTTIDRFLKQQELLRSLLEQSAGVDLTRTKTSISISRMIRLRLGDTFRFFVYHIERHMLQAERTQQ